MIKKLLFVMLFGMFMFQTPVFCQDVLDESVIELPVDVVEEVVEPVEEIIPVEPPPAEATPVWITILTTIIPIGLWLFATYKMNAYGKFIQKISDSGDILTERSAQIEAIGKHLIEITRDKKIDAEEIKSTIKLIQDLVKSFKKPLPVMKNS